MEKENRPKRAEMGGSHETRLEAVAVAIATGATLDEASRQSGAGLTTIKTWLSENPSPLRQRIAELRSELTERVLGRVASGMLTAIDTLTELCTTAKSETTRLKASDSMLGHGIQVIEVADLKRRIEALEQGHR